MGGQWGDKAELTGASDGTPKRLAKWGRHSMKGAERETQRLERAKARQVAGGHSRVLWTCGNVEVRRAFGILSDIRHTVQAHAVLGGPLGGNPRLGKILLGKGLQSLPAARLAGAVTVAA